MRRQELPFITSISAGSHQEIPAPLHSRNPDAGILLLVMALFSSAGMLTSGEAPVLGGPGGASPVSSSPSSLPGGPDRWNLVWNEDFDGADADLDRRWKAQNGPSPHILCSRWRENVVMADGQLTLTNRKEQRGGQDWTSGSIASDKQFLYGYFECRYRYAAATGTNNSFWLMGSDPSPTQGKKFEIDINEGHYPNEISTNIHDWSDVREVNGHPRHPMDPRAFRIGAQPEFELRLETPITTRRLRLVSLDPRPIPMHIREFRAYAPSMGYPDVIPHLAEGHPPIEDHVRASDTVITVSGDIDGNPQSGAKAADGRLDSEWVSQREGGKWIQFDFGADQAIGDVQFISGYIITEKGRKEVAGILDRFSIQYDRDGTWHDLADSTVRSDKTNLSKDFHLYGLEWTAAELVFYFDGKEMRRVKNEFCHSPSPIRLSLAIIAWAGPITAAVDGTSMVVDFVRVYEPRTRR